jgi:hypothetical protein
MNLNNGALIQGQPGPGWSVKRVGDFDGDGKNDFLVQHSDGRVAIWVMNGVTISTVANLLGPSTGWSPVQ